MTLQANIIAGAFYNKFESSETETPTI